MLLMLGAPFSHQRSVTVSLAWTRTCLQAGCCVLCRVRQTNQEDEAPVGHITVKPYLLGAAPSHRLLAP